MSLKTCKDCGTEVSSNATVCPRCGRARPGGGVPGAVTFVTVGVGVAVIVYLLVLLVST